MPIFIYNNFSWFFYYFSLTKFCIFPHMYKKMDHQSKLLEEYFSFSMSKANVVNCDIGYAWESVID